MEKRPFDKSHLYRWLTAAVLLPLVLLVIGLGPEWSVLILVLTVTAAALLELFALLLSTARLWLRVTSLGLGLALPLVAYWQGSLGLAAAATGAIFVALALHMLLYVKGEAILASLGAVVFSLFYVSFPLSHILLLFQQPAGRRWIFFVLFVIFAGDTGAYYAGRRWGRYKLLPAVSPGKTVEGAVGGLFASLALALLAGKLLLPSAGASVGLLWGSGLALAFVGQMGDLIESMLKRVGEVKDASGLLPGHGGLLDRLDSLLFAFPLTYYAVIFFV